MATNPNMMAANPNMAMNPTMMAMQQSMMFQPTGLVPKPNPIPGVPPGLEYLTQIDNLIVKQKREWAEMVTSFEFENKYYILNAAAQQIFFARETSGMCMRQCCGPARSFELHIQDNFGEEVVRVVRELKCACCHECGCFACCDCCAHSLQVEAPPGVPIGCVTQKMSCGYPLYGIVDNSGEEILTIESESCCCCMHPFYCLPEFKVMGTGGEEEIGRVKKKWAGLAAELFTSADNFGIQFPVDLDVKMKAMLLAATFLIDFMFFEQQRR